MSKNFTCLMICVKLNNQASSKCAGFTGPQTFVSALSQKTPRNHETNKLYSLKDTTGPNSHLCLNTDYHSLSSIMRSWRKQNQQVTSLPIYISISPEQYIFSEPQIAPGLHFLRLTQVHGVWVKVLGRS